MVIARNWAKACAVLAGIGLLFVETRSAPAATFPYLNEFDSAGFPGMSSQFTLDTASGTLHYVVSGGATTSVASESVTGVGTSNFIVSSRFILNQTAGSVNDLGIGFGFLSSSPSFSQTSPDSYYLADWTITPTVTNAGRLRLVALGNTAGFTATSGDSDGTGANGSSIVVGHEYELRLTGTYSGGTLNLTLSLWDAAGNQLGTAAVASDTSPLTGGYFGLRNRTAHASQAADINYKYFSVDAAGKPTVNAGADQLISLSVGTAQLAGNVSDDGLPNPPGVVHTLWSVDSQPAGGNATFGDPTSPQTTVHVSAAGTYVLRLTACDNGTPDSCGSQLVSDTMTLNVEGYATWDGGSSSDDNFSSAANWFNDQLPNLTSGVASLEFAGATRTTPNNNVSGVDVDSVLFAANAASFTVGGNGLIVRETIRNNSANLQTLATGPISLADGARIETPAGPLTLSGTVVLPGIAANTEINAQQPVQLTGKVTGAVQTLHKVGTGTVALTNNANDFTGRTTISGGVVELTANNGLGNSAGVPYVDVAGGANGNTALASNDDANAWFASIAVQDNLWNLRNDFGNGDTVFECSASFLEDCPQLKTTVSGLTPGQTYPVYVHYWSRTTQDWAIRAGLASDNMTLFDRTGAQHGGETAVAGTPTGAVSLTVTELKAYLGDAVADGSGHVTVYVDDVPSATNGEVDRSWYDGISLGSGHGTLLDGASSNGQLVLRNGITSPEAIELYGRSSGIAHIVNAADTNTLSGPLALRGAGSYLLQSQGGQLNVSGDMMSIRGAGNLELQGGGTGVISGAIGGWAGIHKVDTGAWTLSGNNSYTGTTTVSAGILKLAAASSTNNIPESGLVMLELGAQLDVTGLSGGTFRIAAGQELQGAGTVTGAVRVGASGKLAVVNTVIPQLTITNGLSFEDGAQIRMALGLNSDLIRITGGTITGSGPDGVVVMIDNKADTLTPGVTYTLLDWSGANAVGLDAEDFTLLCPAMQGTFSISGNTLKFTYGGISPTGNRVVNGTFEEWNTPPTLPDFWPRSGDPGIAQVPGFDGNGHAVQVTNVGAGLSQGLYQQTIGKVVGPFMLAMDFAFEAGTSDRAFNVQVRHGGGRVRINMRTAVDPANPSGPQTLDFFDHYAGLNGGGTGTWRPVAVGLLPSDFNAGTLHPYHLEILGDTSRDQMFVTVTDLTTGTVVADYVDAGDKWDTPPSYDVNNSTYNSAPGPGLNTVQLDGQRITGSYRVDNVVLAGMIVTPAGRFDFDGNGVINDIDLDHFLQCATGPFAAGRPAGCDASEYHRADDDNDGDVDMVDFAAFQRCISIGALADPNCL